MIQYFNDPLKKLDLKNSNDPLENCKVLKNKGDTKRLMKEKIKLFGFAPRNEGIDK